MPVYRARVEASGANGLGAGGDGDAEIMRHLESPSDIARPDQRWSTSWAESIRSRLVHSYMHYVSLLMPTISYL